MFIEKEHTRVWQAIQFNSYPYYISKIDTTHFYMIPKKALENKGKYGGPATYHIHEFIAEKDFYQKVWEFLHYGNR